MNGFTVTALVCLSGFTIGCSVGPIAGGTTDTGNARITAVIHAGDGGRAKKARVTVCPVDYRPGVDADSAERRSLFVKTYTTDDSGSFTTDPLIDGKYSVEVNDLSGRAVLLSAGVSGMERCGELEDTLRPYAAVKGKIRAADPALERWLVVYGMERKIPLEANGSFRIDDLPAGVFHFSVVTENGAIAPIDFDEVSIRPSQTVTIGDTAPQKAKITLNTSPSGADVTGDVYGFPVLVRLTSENFDFSEASENGGDVRFFTGQGKTLPFEIESWDCTERAASVWVRIDTVKANNPVQSFIMQWDGKTGEPAPQGHAAFDTADGFMGIYHLCGSTEDVTVNGFDGIDSGTVDARGLISRARSFDGATQYISLGSLPDRPRGTISCWFKPETAFIPPDSSVESGLKPFPRSLFSLPSQGLWGKYVSDIQNYTLSLQGDDFYTGTGEPSDMEGTIISKLEDAVAGHYVTSTTSFYSGDEWYFAAWSWGDGGDTLYINGAPEAITPGSRPVAGNAPDEIGRSHFDTKNVAGGGPGYFHGLIDEFRIDASCRSASWIRLSYMNQRPDDRLVTVERME